MSRATIATLVAAALLIPMSATAAPEGCGAANPGQKSCSFTVREAATVSEGSGFVGAGSWKVVIKRGKKTITIRSAGFDPSSPARTYSFKKGDKVTATALSPGSWVVAGHG